MTEAAIATVEVPAELTRDRDETPNIILPAHLAARASLDGEKRLFAADATARSYAQNLIDCVDDHEHLRAAAILLLFESGRGPDADGRTEIGKAKKTSSLLRYLAGYEPHEAADFIVKLNADAWQRFAPSERLAAVDHELTHCAVTVAGKHVPPSAVDAWADALGDDLLETRDDLTDEKGRPLIRYLKRTGPVKPGQEGYHDQPYAWLLRKHDIEEFLTVAGRWGTRAATPLRQLVDVMENAEPAAPLLDAAE